MVPTFSIIMTSFNYAPYVGAAIESVLAQSFEDWELLVVDDCSTDDSWAIIQVYKDPRIKAYRQAANSGACAAYNKALSKATGRYIACLDSDDLFMPSKLERHAVFFEKHPEIDVCGTFVSEIDNNGAVINESAPHAEWFNVYVDLNDPSTWLWQNRVCHSGAVVRKEMHDRVGEFDNDLVYTPDWQFWLRTLVSGARFTVISEPLVAYRNHGRNITHKNRQGTLLEHAKTCADILFPWLAKQSRQDLVEAGIQGFVSHPDLSQSNDLAYQVSANLFCSVAKCQIGGGVMQLLVKREAQLAEVNKAKDWLVSELDKARAVKSALEEENHAAKQERDAVKEELFTVYHSLSWKILLPLRMFISRARRLSIITRAIIPVLLRSFSWPRLAKGLKQLIKGDVSEFTSSVKYIYKKETKIIEQLKVQEFFFPTLLSPGQPLVSIVIPCFNYGKYVVDAVDSVLSQTLKNIEVIVVDGGSTDGTTIETLKSLQRPRTNIQLREGRHLVGDNRNFGIALAKGRYICCLDADDTLDLTYLEKAVFHLETYAYDIVSTSINFVGSRNGYIDTLEYPDLNDMANGNHVLTCAIFRKQLWESSGGYFDVGVGKHHVAEDWDFWLRLATKGARIRNISKEYLFNYRVHTGGSLSSAADVKSLLDQKKMILKRNRDLLSPEAFQNSAHQQSRYLRCNPQESALALSYDEQIITSKKLMLLTIPFSMVGGAERLLSGLCSYLTSSDWRIIVVTTLEHKPTLGSSIDWFKEITPEVYELTKFLEPTEREDFIKYLLASRKPDCLLNAGSRLIYEMLPVIKGYSKNLCVVDLLFNTEGHTKSHLEFKKYITSTFAENMEVYDWLINRAGWIANKIKKMSSGVDLSYYQPMPRPKFLTDKYGITDDEIVIGFSGRLSEEKGPDLFLEIAELCNGISNLRFVMTGAGPMKEVLMYKIKLLPAQIKFEFAGLVDNVTPYLALYDILILPSRTDGRPLVAMEALASGVPVVASVVGGLPELIDDGRNGYLLPVGSTKVFADKIRDLAQDKSLLAQLKAGARKSAENKLDANKAYLEYDVALREAIDQEIAEYLV